MARWSIWLVLLLTCAGCGGSIDRGAALADLKAADRDFAALCRQQGMRTAFLQTMAAGATIFREGSDPLTGEAALSDHFKPGTAGILAWDPYFADLAASGDLGYTLGRYLYTVDDAPGAEPVSTGYYVTIWRKNAAGQWKYVFDAGVESPATPEHRALQEP